MHFGWNSACSSWQRITIPEILQDEWFKKGYKPPKFEQDEDVNLDDIDAVFNDSTVRHFIIVVVVSIALETM